MKLGYIMLMLLISVLAGYSQTRSYPDIPFNERYIIAMETFNADEASFGRKITQKLKTALFQSRCFRIVEREKLETILREQALGLAGVTTGESPGVGKILSAGLILTGDIVDVAASANKKGYDASDTHMKGVKAANLASGKVIIQIACNLLDATTSELIASVQTEGSETRRGLSGNIDGLKIDLGSDKANDREEMNMKAADKAIELLVSKLIAEVYVVSEDEK